jgi:hypothetical protein
VAMSRPVSFSSVICTEAIRPPSRVTRPVAVNFLPMPWLQVVGAQVDGADAAEAVADLFGRFAVEFFGDGDRDGQAADRVEHVAMTPPCRRPCR